MIRERVAVASVALALAGCDIVEPTSPSLDRVIAASSERPQHSVGPLRVRWRRAMHEELSGAYSPIEATTPGLDPAHDRVYAGSAAGELVALDTTGRVYWKAQLGGAIEAQPQVVNAGGEVIVGTVDGVVASIETTTGRQRWEARVGGPIRGIAAVSDALYVVTALDRVVALAVATGRELWSYQRPLPDAYALAGHSGVVATERAILAGCTDGNVVALDPIAGEVLWERDTSLDAEPGRVARFFDVDATPIVVDGLVWVASLEAGLFVLEADTGSVRSRNAELGGILGLVDTGDCVIATGENGVECIDRRSQEVRWRRRVTRGAAVEPTRLGADLLLYGESRGGLVAIRVTDGVEVGRIDLGMGVAGRAAVAGSLGFSMSNGGMLVAFTVSRLSTNPARPSTTRRTDLF